MVPLIARNLSFTLGIAAAWVRAAQDTSLPMGNQCNDDRMLRESKFRHAFITGVCMTNK